MRKHNSTLSNEDFSHKSSLTFYARSHPQHQLLPRRLPLTDILIAFKNTIRMSIDSLIASADTLIASGHRINLSAQALIVFTPTAM